jgi:uncharacterized protein (TIGR02145 family)
MKLKIILSALTIALMLNVNGQKPVIELTFTGIDNDSYIQLDSIKVMNQTQGVDTILYFPDTVLVLEYEYPAGIDDMKGNKTGLSVFQNYPNPVHDQTIITIYIPEKNNVTLMIKDIMGRQIIKKAKMLDKGYHLFRFSPGDGNLFFFIAESETNIASIKILHASSSVRQENSLEYICSKNSVLNLKTTEFVQNFAFSMNDNLLYIGYANALESGIPDTPETSETDTFQFSSNIPCPGTPTVTYEGQVYNTIQIFSQCWMKENLNVGTRINGSQNMANNGILEKYCYDNLVANCNIYGGLYAWNEMMKYTTTVGSQGICPDGWHIPSDDEFKVLEGAADSLYGIGNGIWNISDFRGFDIGRNLKSSSTTLWLGGEGTDKFGFTGLPGGMMWEGGNFTYDGCYGFFWSSSLYGSNAWRRILICAPDDYARKTGKDSWPVTSAMSVRCLKN